MAMKDALLTEFDHEMGTTRKLIDRVPDDRLSWKPHAKSMSMGGLITHLANLPYWGSLIMDADFFDLADSPPPRVECSSREAALEMFDGRVRSARAALDRSDAEYLAPWTLKRAGQQIFTMPRAAALRSFVLSHSIHHRGQLSVYLRLNDVPVPAMYGPTADEG